MNDLAKLLAPPTSEQAPFPASSRYYGQGLRRGCLPDGREVAFVARRFLPSLDAYQQTDVHSVQGSDRLDLLGAQYFADPEAGWRIVEANGIRDPREALQQTGSRLVIATVSATAARGSGA